MKKNAHSGHRLPKSGLSFIASIIIVTGLTLFALPVQLSAAEANSAAPELPKRVIVKFKPGLAQEVEKALPASLELAAPDKAVRPEWFQRHGVKSLKPLYRQWVRQKKDRGASFAQQVNEVRGRFAERSRRARPGNEPPDLSSTYILELSALSELALTQEIARLNADPEIEYAQRELIATAQFTPNDPFYSSTGTWGQTYADLWGLYAIQCGTAWDTSTGQGIVVAVVDTGVDITHSDLAGNIWTNAAEIAGNGIDDDGNGFVDDVFGWDFVGPSYANPAPDNNPVDAHGHGTHVAGTIAAAGNNALGVIGVAWGARIMPVRGLDNTGTGTDAELANAVIYAANNGADVINNSYGGTGYSQVMKDAMDYAHSLGVVIVAAAGNSSSDVRNFFPASYPDCIVVTATDANDTNASFSNWGERVDVAAPGVDILSLRAAGTTLGTPLGTDLTRASGTSMATPHVSGLAALILAQHPDYSPEQVRQALRASADDVNAPGVDIYTGYGRVNATRAMALPPVLEARIQSPSFEQAVTGPVAIQGVAQGPGFDHYTLEYGAGQTPAAWTLILQSTTPVAGGTLGIFDPSTSPDGRCTIRLRAFNQAGTVFEDKLGLIVGYTGITNPAASISIDNVFKPGTVVSISGHATGPSFQGYQLQWARGASASNGWSTAGMTVTGGGAAPVIDAELGRWETPSTAAADFYTIRLLVQNDGFTNEDRALIYLEPDLASTNDPVFLDLALELNNSILPATDASGNIWLQGLAYNFSQNPQSPARLWTFSPDLSLVSTQAMVNSGYNQPAIGDFDGLPGDEVVVVENNRLQVFSSDLTSWFLNPVAGTGLAMSPVVMADLDGDGQFEVLALGIAANNTSWLHAWTRSGVQLTTNFPVAVTTLDINTSFFAQNKILAVDLDGDGKKEILVVQGVTGSNAFSFAAFNWDGTPRPWPGMVYPGRFHQFAAGDFNRDGRAEIVFTYSDSSNGGWNRAGLLGADGAMKSGWPVDLGGIYAGENEAYIAIADMDRDGFEEIVIASKQMLHVLRADGTPMNSSWPMNSYLYTLAGLAVADIDGDTFPEILCSRWKNVSFAGEPFTWPYTLGAYNRNAQEVKSWPLFNSNGSTSDYHGCVTVGDFNQDGKVDIVVHEPMLTSSGRVEGGVVTAFALNAPYRAQDMDWPMNQHDPQNSAVRIPPLDHTPPVVTITAPANGATVSNTVTLAATATDDVHVAGVQFLLDGLNVGAEDTAPPYTASWSTQGFTNGAHTVSAVARDNFGNRTTAAVTVTLANAAPPNVVITAPTNQQEVAGTIIVSASASAEAGVAGVQFRLDGANLGAEKTNAPFTVSWNTHGATNGTHTLSAIVRDTAGFTNADTVTVSVNNDYTPPTVSFISPTNGAVVAGTVTITVAVSDNVAVSNVYFFCDNTYVANATVSPYSVGWATTMQTNGTHTLWVRVWDTSGNQTDSAINVTVINDLSAPTVSITSPTNNGVVSGTVTVSAVAADDIGVVGVQFQLDGANFGTEQTVPPYALSWNSLTVPNGGHTWAAVARDAVGHRTTATAYITVTNYVAPPSVTITAPTNQQQVAGTINVSANASAEGGVAGVQFRIDGANIGAEQTNAPFTVSWNTRGVTNGTHTLSAIARVTAGFTNADTITVTVNNDVTPPTVSFISRTNGAVVTGGFAVTAAASDDVAVTSVTFICDTTFLGTATAPPYSVGWNTRLHTNGTHTLRADAFDSSGNRTTCTINVTVTNNSSVSMASLTTPTNNAVVSGTVTVHADPAANVSVAGVQFKWDTANIGAEVTTAPFTIAWNTRTVPGGTHTLSAVARDVVGAKTTSSITVVVTNDLTFPTISITAPANNASVVGTVTISANASDNVGVVGVQFQVDGTNFGSEFAAPPYTLNWNSLSVTNGGHTLGALARDAAGNVTPTSVSVIVKNPPSISISSPTNNAAVSGVINVSALASATAAAVQFRLDKTNFGPLLLTPPYTVSWDTTSGTNATHSWDAYTWDTAGNFATSAVVTVTVTNSIKINFQPATSPIYSGYAVDSGAVYGLQSNGYSYGWNASNSKNTADRNSSLSLDQRYDTLITMQTGGTFTWEIGLPNGRYSVHVVAGDASNFNNTTYKINVEGVLTVNATPTTTARWAEGTSIVTVADGRLTISNATGSKNNKLCFLEITPVP